MVKITIINGGYNYYSITLWSFNIAMKNGPFTNKFPIKTSIYNGFSIAMLNNQVVLYYYECG
jgi:hypothetical protein